MVGNAFEVHYCKGELSGISFFGNASCEMEQAPLDGCHKMECDHHTANVEKGINHSRKIQKPSCCSTENWDLGSSNRLVKNESHLTDLQRVVLMHFFPIYLFEESTLNQPSFPYLDPDIRANIPVLFQSFLI